LNLFQSIHELIWFLKQVREKKNPLVEKNLKFKREKKANRTSNSEILIADNTSRLK